jgi:hypothetical protein
MNIIDYYMILIFFIGIILVTYEYSIRTVKCPADKVIYKYITVNDLNEKNLLDEVIDNMFNKKSPWIGSIENKKKD